MTSTEFLDIIEEYNIKKKGHSMEDVQSHSSEHPHSKQAQFIIQNNCGRYLSRKQAEEAELILSPHGLLLMEQKSSLFVSELVLIDQGRRLFWQEHIRFLQIHCEEKELPIPEEDELEELYHRLMHCEEKENSLLRIVVTEEDIVLHYTKVDLQLDHLKEGVKCQLLHWDKEDAWDYDKRFELGQMSTQALERGEDYLLVDEDGVIYRGARNNVYFIFEDKIVTAPGEALLNGISRKYIFQAAKEAGLRIEEDGLHMSDLRSDKVQAAFLVSSLVHIIEISHLEDLSLQLNHPSLLRLKKAYFELLEDLGED